MSRIGKKPILIDASIKIVIDNHKVNIEGPCGKMRLTIPSGLEVKSINDQLEIRTLKENNQANSIYGLFRTLVQNAVSGVKKEWQKTLEMVGVGYRAQTDGKDLVLNLGFSHPVKISAPEGIKFKVSENKIIILGIDRYLVGEIAASVRRIKPPEPYKGKGIRYEGEYIRKKLGKAAKTVGGTIGAK